MIYSNLILLTILLLFVGTLKSQSIFKTVIQNGNDFEIKLEKPLFFYNITSLDNLYYDYDLNGTSVLNSCIFNSNYFSLNLTNLKNVDFSFQDNHQSTASHFFSICSDLSFYPAQSVITYPYQYPSKTGNLNEETFELGKFGIDYYALKLTYKDSNSFVFQYVGGVSIRNYYFQCDENQEFNITVPYDMNHYDTTVDAYIKTKYVCSYKNTKKTSIKYSLIQPNILRFTLDENSSNLISINNNDIQVLPIIPIINSCENNGDIITVKGSFFKSLLSKYIFYFEGENTIDPSNIISFNSTTLVINSEGFVDNNFYILFFRNKSESYPILKPQQQMVLSSYMIIDYEYYKHLIIDCSNCNGAKLMGLPQNYTKNIGREISIDISSITLSDGGIYFESPIHPYKRSGVLPLPTNFWVAKNEIFEFYGSSIVTISGYFIPKVYDNQAYILGKLEFSNGTIYNLDYYTLNNSVYTEGKFKIPSGYGNGNFSIYIKDKLVHSNTFTYTTPSKWVSSITQNLEKVQLQLSFPFSFFQITSIKYNNKNGKDLDYTLIEPNIISFTLNTYSTNVVSFNDDYHIETLTPNGSNFRPIIYSYSIENDTITMEGLFVSLLNYKIYLGADKKNISFDLITYFDNSRLSFIMNQTSHVYVYSDEYSFTMVPDLTITSDQDQLLFTCSNCLGGYININEPQSNQDSQFSQNGTIVKQFNTNTILNKYNVFTFTKDSKTLAIQPPLPTNVIIDASLLQFSTFSNNSIIVSGDFLMDKFNGLNYTDFQFQFDNGTIYSTEKQILSRSDQNYKYQINIPFAYGYGNFGAFITFENGRKFKLNSIPFNYPTKPIINSISKIKDGNLKINGDGFLDVIVVASFKTTTGIFSETIECYPKIINQNINCQFEMNPNSKYSLDAPITIQIKSPEYSNFQFEPVYTQTFFDTNLNSNSNSNSEIKNSDISLHSVFSKLLATLFILISILLQ
ncbi:hypothetical protein ACTFIZ_012723 [Dictyostelium cf. discoideum]